MAVKLGTTGINKVYLGANEMNKVYLGSTEVYSSAPPAPNDAFELTVETTTNGESFLLPLTGVTSIDVDWGDGTVDIGITADNPTHTYASAGTHSISVTGSATSVVFRNSGSESKLRTVTNLGALGWNNLSDSFRECANMTSFECGDTDTSGVVAFTRAFRFCSSLTVADVSGFDTSSALSINRTFEGCSLLENLAIDGWDVTLVTDGTSFLSSANLALTTAQYDAVLIAWAAQAVKSNVPMHFGDATYTAGGAAEAARNTLTGTYGWVITDGGPA